MVSILKTFGLGLLCTLLSPLILLVFVLYFIYTFISIIIMFIIDVVRFFKGRSVLDELEIEKKAHQILKSQEEYNQKMQEAFMASQSQFGTPQTYPSFEPRPINTTVYSEQTNNVEPLNNIESTNYTETKFENTDSDETNIIPQNKDLSGGDF